MSRRALSTEVLLQRAQTSFTILDKEGMPEAERAAVAAAAGEIVARLTAWITNGSLPKSCVYCQQNALVRNGVYERNASLLILGHVVHFAGIWGQRVKCGACLRGYRLRADEVVPHKHYQPCVVSSSLNQCILSTPPRTLAATACAHHCSVQTVARWVHWVARIADASLVIRQICLHTQAEVRLPLPAHLATVDVPAALPSQNVLKETQATLTDGVRAVCGIVLIALEALASALGLLRPGLLGTLKRFVGNRAHVATYRCPVIPEFVVDKPP